MGGSSRNEGRVEIQFAGQWGTVCDDAWGRNDGNVRSSSGTIIVYIAYKLKGLTITSLTIGQNLCEWKALYSSSAYTFRGMIYNILEWLHTHYPVTP